MQSLGRARTLVSLILVAAVFAACAKGASGGGNDDDDDGDGGSGAEGGAGVGQGGAGPSTGGAGPVGPGPSSGPGPGPASNSSSISSGPASSSSGGPGSCDNTGDCDTCQQCANVAPGECADEYDICVANPECFPLNDCLFTCGTDQVCIDNCFATYPGGLDDLSTAANCVFCEACYVDCDGASSGCI